MSAFSNIPPHAVLPLGSYDVDELRKAASRADQKLFDADCSDAKDKNAVMTALAKAMSLPAHFGKNLDALYDSITDLQPPADAEHPGFVVILRELPDGTRFDSKQREALLDVFRDAADFFYDRKTAFRVFYSVAKTK